MRKLTLTLAPIILLTFLFPSSAFGETMEDLVKGEGLYYKEFIERPFTGKVTGRSQGWFRRSKKDGPWVKFGDNEQVQFKGNHKNGIRKGPWVGYGSKEPTRMVRKSVLGSFTMKAELCGTNSRGPTSTVIRSNRS